MQRRNHCSIGELLPGVYATVKRRELQYLFGGRRMMTCQIAIIPGITMRFFTSAAMKISLRPPCTAYTQRGKYGAEMIHRNTAQGDPARQNCGNATPVYPTTEGA